MKKPLIVLLIVAMALVGTACVKLGGKPLDKRYYRIAPVRQTSQPRPAQGISLMVRRLGVSELYNSREIVYQMADGRMESDFYNLYFVNPASMLSSELRTWLDASGAFPHVIAPGSMVVPTLTLEGTVSALYGDYSTTPPVAVVDMQFFLVDESSSDNTIIFSKNYSQRVPLDQPDPQETVRAMTQGVQTIFTRLEADLAATKLQR
jgi:cholesterol transport system auxiliary component